MDENNRYTAMQKSQYLYGTSNHPEHNKNKDYWDILLKDIKEKQLWENKKALDFACGKGRNVTNLLSLASWSTVDGVDISPGNIVHCKQNYKKQKSRWYVNNGVDIQELKTEEYDFVMSTIALQHIPVYDIRKNILKDILRVMKKGAIFSFQVAYGPESPGKRPASYYDNIFNAEATNSAWDFRVNNEQQVIEDLSEIGFSDISTEVRESFSDNQHPQWIYIRCKK